jgi:hypothetical protein
MGVLTEEHFRLALEAVDDAFKNVVPPVQQVWPVSPQIYALYQSGQITGEEAQLMSCGLSLEKIRSGKLNF